MAGLKAFENLRRQRYWLAVSILLLSATGLAVVGTAQIIDGWTHWYARQGAAPRLALPVSALLGLSATCTLTRYRAMASTASAGRLADAARDQGVLLNALGPTKVRLVTHLDVSAAQAREAGDVLARILN